MFEITLSLLIRTSFRVFSVLLITSAAKKNEFSRVCKNAMARLTRSWDQVTNISPNSVFNTCFENKIVISTPVRTSTCTTCQFLNLKQKTK